DIEVTIGNSTDLSILFNTTEKVVIRANSEDVVRFMYDFRNGTLDLRDLEINKTNGAVLVKGLHIANKTVLLKKTAATNYLCIKDADVSSISTTIACNGTEERLLSCPASGDISCSIVSGFYEVGGLTHSLVKEYVCEIEWSCSEWGECVNGSRTRSCECPCANGLCIGENNEEEACETQAQREEKEEKTTGGGGGGGGGSSPIIKMPERNTEPKNQTEATENKNTKSSEKPFRPTDFQNNYSQKENRKSEPRPEELIREKPEEFSNVAAKNAIGMIKEVSKKYSKEIFIATVLLAALNVALLLVYRKHFEYLVGQGPRAQVTELSLFAQQYRYKENMLLEAQQGQQRIRR
ncbi:MAG: hypothetical protein QXK37_05390, partial [Candidatus Woesearchaeota archaeon]